MLDLETDVESDAECDMVDNLAVRNRILWLEAQIVELQRLHARRESNAKASLNSSESAVGGATAADGAGVFIKLPVAAVDPCLRYGSGNGRSYLPSHQASGYRGIPACAPKPHRRLRRGGHTPRGSGSGAGKVRFAPQSPKARTQLRSPPGSAMRRGSAGTPRNKSYDMDDVVMPVNLKSGASSLEVATPKEIFTPKYRKVAEDQGNLSAGVTRVAARESQVGPSDSSGSDEDTSDEAYTRRHEVMLVKERAARSAPIPRRRKSVDVSSTAGSVDTPRSETHTPRDGSGRSRLVKRGCKELRRFIVRRLGADTRRASANGVRLLFRLGEEEVSRWELRGDVAVNRQVATNKNSSSPKSPEPSKVETPSVASGEAATPECGKAEAWPGEGECGAAQKVEGAAENTSPCLSTVCVMELESGPAAVEVPAA